MPRSYAFHGDLNEHGDDPGWWSEKYVSQQRTTTHWPLFTFIKRTLEQDATLENDPTMQTVFEATMAVIPRIDLLCALHVWRIYQPDTEENLRLSALYELAKSRSKHLFNGAKRSRLPSHRFIIECILRGIMQGAVDLAAKVVTATDEARYYESLPQQVEQLQRQLEALPETCHAASLQNQLRQVQYAIDVGIPSLQRKVTYFEQEKSSHLKVLRRFYVDQLMAVEF